MKPHRCALLLLILAPGFASPAAAAPFAREVYCQSSFKSQSFFILLPDGHVRAGLPKGGLEAFDFAKDRAENPKITGVYAWNGDQLTFTFGGRAPYTWTRKRMPNGDEEMQGFMWIKERPFAPDQKLDGTYEGGGSVGVGTGTSVIATSGCTFRPDGTFTWEKSAVTSGRAAAAGANVLLSGTYSLAGYTFTLKNHDGSTTSHTICHHFKPKDPTQPAVVVLDGRLMTRK